MDVIVIDSVAALVPKAELEGEMGDHHIGTQVKYWSKIILYLIFIFNYLFFFFSL
jgi:recombination protein RecA